MDINYLEAFKDYNPLREKLPEELQWMVGHIRQRSGWILKNRTIHDLNATLVLIQEVIDKSVFGVLAAGKYEDKFDEEGALFLTTPMQIFSYRDQIDLSEMTTIPDLDWAEFFVIYALSRIGFMVTIKSHSTPSNLDYPKLASPYERQLIVLGLEAMEALAYAESLRWVDEVKKAPHVNRANTMKKIKEERYLPVKLEIANQVNAQEKKITDIDLAGIIYSNLGDLTIKIDSDDPVHRIAVWIGQYRAGKIAGIEHLPPYNPKHTSSS